MFPPDGVGSRCRNWYKPGTDTCPKGACGIESLRVEQKGSGSQSSHVCEMAGERTYGPFELRIGQLTLNLEVVTKKRIGQCLWLLAASMLEEIRKVVDRPRWKFRHGCETQTALEPLRISAPQNPSIDEYKSRMIDHKWEPFLVFPPVQKLPTA
jgi:hypothetical protein